MATKFLLVSVHGYRWSPAASGASRRANVGLCPASMLCPQKRPLLFFE